MSDNGSNFVEPDPLLATFNDLANRGMEASLTLLVGGSIVSGTLIGYTTYFDGLAEEISQSGGEIAQGMASGIRRAIEKAQADQAPKQDQESQWFIHLRDAQIYSPSGDSVPTLNGVWWRGRMSSVDGFIMGKLEREEQSLEAV